MKSGPNLGDSAPSSGDVRPRRAEPYVVSGSNPKPISENCGKPQSGPGLPSHDAGGKLPANRKVLFLCALGATVAKTG